MRRRDEFELLNSRIAIILGGVLLVFGVLVVGFWRTQIGNASYYRQLAEENRIRDIPLTAERGRIYDREYRVLADNVPAWSLSLIPENSLRSPAETVALLAPGLEASESDLLARVRAAAAQPAHRAILLHEDLSLSEISYVRGRKYEIPEVSLDYTPRRRYPNGEIAAHALGYVGEITPEQLDSGEFEGHRAGDVVGQVGLEQQYDALLQGTHGFRRVLVDTFQRQMGQIGEAPPMAGRDLRTTIDLDLQRAAEAALGASRGAVVALSPATGEVLALVSRPAYDPTAFSRGIAEDDWNALVSDPGKPFQNRAVQSRFSPGSIFKIFMTAAGLQEDVIDLEEHIACHGHATLYGESFHCWNTAGHGPLTIYDALIHSCNVFFYLVGDRLGIDRISEHAVRMGLGRRTGIDLPHENPGLIPSRQWKMDVQSTPWYAGETPSVSIGQGAVSVTPLQLAWAVGGVAIGGKLVPPRLVAASDDGAGGGETRAGETYPLGEEAARAIRDALWGVVNSGGTGAAARIDGADIAGKTGTAQVVASGNAGDNPELQPHGWFVGFAPFDAPEIALSVFVENGGGSSAALPLARQVFQAYFDKKNGAAAGAADGLE